MSQDKAAKRGQRIVQPLRVGLLQPQPCPSKRRELNCLRFEADARETKQTTTRLLHHRCNPSCVCCYHVHYLLTLPSDLCDATFKEYAAVIRKRCCKRKVRRMSYVSSWSTWLAEARGCTLWLYMSTVSMAWFTSAERSSSQVLQGE